MYNSTSFIPNNLPNLSAEDSIYEKGFATYKSLLDLPDVLTYFNNNIDKFVSDTTSPCRILSIGCGDGQLDLDLLNIISRRFPQLDIDYIGVEPNEYRLQQFKEKITSYPSVSRYRLRLEQLDLDGYTNKYSNEQFNLILCMRVLYFMHDRLESTFAQLINKLVEKGKLLCMHKSPSGMPQIIRLMGLDQQSPTQYCNTYHLRQALKTLTRHKPSLHFNIMYLDGYIDITCLKHINSNEPAERENALNLLSFFTGKNLMEVDGKLLEKIMVERILPVVSFPSHENNDTYLMFQPAGILIVELH